MEVICLETAAFQRLLEEVVNRLKEKHNITQDRWISDADAMKLLGISSKTTLLKLRQEGAIRFTQPQKKIILYFRPSIEAYLEKHVKETF
jgi:hypothetical protein